MVNTAQHKYAWSLLSIACAMIKTTHAHQSTKTQYNVVNVLKIAKMASA